jgi:hypothetical protein
MPASTYLSNPSVKVGAAIGTIVDITDQVSAATLTVTVYASYAASESYAVLAPLLGTKCTIKVNPTSAADSATNPGFILTDTYLASIPVVNAALGELSTYELEFQGGTYSVDVTAP